MCIKHPGLLLIDREIPSNSLFEVKRWALSWGRDAKVLAPAILIEQVREEISGMGSIYS